MRDAVMINNWIENDDEKEVHFVKENFVLHRNSKSNDKFIWGIKVTTAQYYLDNLSEEVKKGQKEKIRQGWLPTKAPYGYKTVGEKGRKIHIIDESIGVLVKKLFELYASGDYSIKKLVDKMYDLGLRSSGGRQIPKSRIHKILTDPFYIGKMVWNGIEYPAQHKPLIDLTTFEKVSRVLSSKNTPKYGKHDYLFKGLFKCYECNGTITWEEKKKIMYGHCNHYKQCSVTRWSKEKTIEENLVIELAKLKITNTKLMEWLGRALKETNQIESDFYLNSVGEFDKQREILKKRLDAIYMDKIDGKITESYYNEKFKDFSKQLEGLDEKIAEHTRATNSGQNKRITLFDIAQKGESIFLKGKPDKKRELLRMIFINLKLKEDKIYYDLDENFTLIRDLVNKTNSSKLGKLVDSGDQIFVQHDLTKVSDYYATLEPQCSSLLPRVDSDHEPTAYK
jgi:hypothetical protein